MALLATTLALGIVIACVSVHYEMLRWLSILEWKQQRWYSSRLRAGLLVFGCLVAHMLEVGLFGIGYRILDASSTEVTLRGLPIEGVAYSYYSAVVYTSIGFGDVIPITMPMRILTAVEGLTGAILIAWTASFMFFTHAEFLGRPGGSGGRRVMR